MSTHTIWPPRGLRPGKPENPQISVIIPVHNAAFCLQRCLEAVASSTFSDFEVIVADDGSTDSTRSIAERFDVVYLCTSGPAGPAAARNLGAKQAKGEILLFVDADVVLRNSALEMVAQAFREDSQLTAVFGSYDDKPAWNNWISQYKNLLHHYVHQISSSEGSTFWTGIGAIRKSAFEEAGGFNEKRYRRPAIEDIELGYRLRQANKKIVLEKRLQGKHLKKWTLWSLLDSDILCRAIPWSRLILETRTLPRDLNLQLSDRVSALFVGLLALMTPVLLLQYRSLLSHPAWFLFFLAWLVLLSATLFLNRHLYRFFARRKGWGFTLRAIALHLFYYFYSGVIFVGCWILFRVRTWALAFLTVLGWRASKPAKQFE